MRIELCEFMISYCNNLRPVEGKATQEEKNAKAAQDLNLAKEKGWEKEAKSGCAVIVSKKDKLDE